VSRPLLALIASALVACGHTDVHQALLRKPDGAHRARAELYLAHQKAPRAFHDVALLQAIGQGHEATSERLAQVLAERGGSLGCDAVVDVQIDVGFSVAHAYGVCVRWIDGAAAPTLTPAGEPLRASARLGSAPGSP